MTARRFAELAAVAILALAIPAHAQDRQRAVRPYAFELFARSSLYATGQLGADRYLYIFIRPNYRIGTTPDAAGGMVPLKVWRARQVQSTVAGGPVRTMFCAVTILNVQAVDYVQIIRIDTNSFISPVRPNDRIAFEHRDYWSISTSLDADGVRCVSCDYAGEKVAPGMGFPVPNGSCL